MRNDEGKCQVDRAVVDLSDLYLRVVAIQWQFRSLTVPIKRTDPDESTSSVVL